MKTKIAFILISMFLLSGISAQAQTAREKKKMEKAAKKAAQMKQDSINNQRLKELVATKAFVLEAHTLYGRSGASFQLNSTTNFVGFDGKNSTIQLAFDQLIGWNGLGGITLEGTIGSMEIKDNKNGLGFSINATVRQKGGSVVTMIFRVSSDGNARVDMSGSFGERLSFQGIIVSLDETRVYKGTSLY